MAKGSGGSKYTGGVTGPTGASQSGISPTKPGGPDAWNPPMGNGLDADDAGPAVPMKPIDHTDSKAGRDGPVY